MEVLSQEDNMNPHIKRFPISSGVDAQLEAVASGNPHHTCLYPSTAHLRSVVDQSRFEDSPFTLELALGASHLEFQSFDLAVLEFYRNDPRYYSLAGSTQGTISVSDDYYRSNEMLERDKVVLQSFGFSISADLDRAVAVF